MTFCVSYFKNHFISISSSSKSTISVHFNESSNLQLINGISDDLQNLLKHFNGTAIFTPFFVPLFSVLPIIFDLYLNEGALLSLITSALLVISSLLKFYKLLEVSE